MRRHVFDYAYEDSEGLYCTGTDNRNEFGGISYSINAIMSLFRIHSEIVICLWRQYLINWISYLSSSDNRMTWRLLNWRHSPTDCGLNHTNIIIFPAPANNLYCCIFVLLTHVLKINVIRSENSRYHMDHFLTLPGANLGQNHWKT